MSRKYGLISSLFLVASLVSCGTQSIAETQYVKYYSLFQQAYPDGFSFEDGWYLFKFSATDMVNSNQKSPSGFFTNCYAKLAFEDEHQRLMGERKINGELKSKHLKAKVEQFEMHSYRTAISKEYPQITSDEIKQVDIYFDGEAYFKLMRYFVELNEVMTLWKTETFGGTSFIIPDPKIIMTSYPLYHIDEWVPEGINDGFEYRFHRYSPYELEASYSENCNGPYVMEMDMFYSIGSDGKLAQCKCVAEASGPGSLFSCTMTMEKTADFKVGVPKDYETDVSGTKVDGFGLALPSVND